MLKSKSFFDWTVFKNSFLRSIKYIWSIVAMIFFSFFIFALFIMFAPSIREGEDLPIFYPIFGMVWLFLLLTFDSIDLANVFIEDRNRGLLNMELRKGRNSNQIMISRFIANKVITLTMSVIVLLSLIIFLAIIRPGELNSLPLIIFLILPLEFLGVGIFLFFFSFGFNKIASFAFQLYFSLFSWLFFQPANWIFLSVLSQTNTSLSPFVVETMRAALIADETLDLAYTSQENELNSFAYQLVNEAYLLDNFLINAESQSFTLNNRNEEELEIQNRVLAFALPLGILNADDANQLFNNNDALINVINPNFEDSLLYRLNNYVIDNPALSTSFSNSVYGPDGWARSNVQYTLNELKKTIEIINTWSDTHNIVGAREFNQLLLRIARTEIGAAGDRNIPIDYSLSPLYHISQQQTPDMNYLTQLNLNINDNQINTQVGLKLWNETVMKMLYQASITRWNPINLSQTLAISRTLLYLIPGSASSEIARNPNQHLDPFERFVEARTASGLIFSNYFRGNRFININGNQESFTNINIYRTDISNTIGMTFSHIGYIIFLFIFSFILIIISVFIFNKKLKK